jgi:hypothetical protein
VRNQIDGTFHCTQFSDLMAYDRLPRPVRDILKTMLHDLAAEAIERDLMVYPLDRELADLRETDILDRQDERDDRTLARGVWQGNVPLAAESARK